MTLQVEIEFGWVGDFTIDHSSRVTISTTITIPLVLREKSMHIRLVFENKINE